ncbi:helix-turn-helix domain-containing protein [Streptomyces collinus]|uniref:helix-turn-helix domain-containing protein n=1 Tax=Streptomyces collinus TaxID=42684 RepID=UPI0033E9DFCB
MTLEPAPGSIVGRRLGGLRIVDVAAGPQTVTRSSRQIARDGQESLILSLQHQGSSLKEQDGRKSVIRPGEFSLSDSSRRFRKRIDGNFRFTAFHFPPHQLRVREGDLRAVTATAFGTGSGSGALVARFFSRMAREAAGFDDAVGRQVAATALDLLALLIDERRGRLAPASPESTRATLVRVQDHIMRHLSDPALSPAGIAAAHFMSVRSLHKLFQAQELTVGGWIRLQRLERSRRDLLRPDAQSGGVAAVARRWGFVSPSHFSRSFRTAYGMTPSQWQFDGTPDARNAASDAQDATLDARNAASDAQDATLDARSAVPGV